MLGRRLVEIFLPKAYSLRTTAFFPFLRDLCAHCGEKFELAFVERLCKPRFFAFPDGFQFNECRGAEDLVK